MAPSDATGGEDLLRLARDAVDEIGRIVDSCASQHRGAGRDARDAAVLALGRMQDVSFKADTLRTAHKIGTGQQSGWAPTLC